MLTTTPVEIDTVFEEEPHAETDEADVRARFRTHYVQPTTDETPV